MFWWCTAFSVVEAGLLLLLLAKKRTPWTQTLCFELRAH
jgi:hypothetical protein